LQGRSHYRAEARSRIKISRHRVHHTIHRPRNHAPEIVIGKSQRRIPEPAVGNTLDLPSPIDRTSRGTRRVGLVVINLGIGVQQKTKLTAIFQN